MCVCVTRTELDTVNYKNQSHTHMKYSVKTFRLACEKSPQRYIISTTPNVPKINKIKNVLIYFINESIYLSLYHYQLLLRGKKDGFFFYFVLDCKVHVYSSVGTLTRVCMVTLQQNCKMGLLFIHKDSIH